MKNNFLKKGLIAPCYHYVFSGDPIGCWAFSNPNYTIRRTSKPCTNCLKQQQIYHNPPFREQMVSIFTI